MLDELEWLRGSFGADLFNLLHTPVQCMVADTIQDFYKLEHDTAINIVDVRSIVMHQRITQGQFCSGAARLFLLKKKSVNNKS